MDEEKLVVYTDTIDHFDTLTGKEQILIFGNYLQTEEKYQSFKVSDIRECFEKTDTPLPVNISARMIELRKDKKLLSKGKAAFRLSRTESDRLNLNVISKSLRIEKVYKPGEIYDFYRDIQKITFSAKNEVFIIDAYAHEDIIELYLDKLPVGTKIMILTSTPKGNFLNVAKKFKQKHGNCFKVKSNKNCHDRLFFADKKCYVIGQSIEKAAMDKPTYVCEIQNGGSFRDVFQKLFDSGKSLI